MIVEVSSRMVCYCSTRISLNVLTLNKEFKRINSSLKEFPLLLLFSFQLSNLGIFLLSKLISLVRDLFNLDSSFSLLMGKLAVELVSSLFHLPVVVVSQLSNLLLAFRIYLVELAVVFLLQSSCVVVVLFGLGIYLQLVGLVSIFQSLEMLLFSLCLELLQSLNLLPERVVLMDHLLLVGGVFDGVLMNNDPCRFNVGLEFYSLGFRMHYQFLVSCNVLLDVFNYLEGD